MSSHIKDTIIPYTMGFSISEHPLADGESINVAFLSTVAHITRNSADDYRLETHAPSDLKTPGRGALHGAYTNFAVAKKVLGREYCKAAKATYEKAGHLTAAELDECMANIGSMLVNTQAYHDETLARRELEKKPPTTPYEASHKPEAAPLPARKRMIDNARGVVRFAHDFMDGRWQEEVAARMLAQKKHDDIGRK